VNDSSRGAARVTGDAAAAPAIAVDHADRSVAVQTETILDVADAPIAVGEAIECPALAGIDVAWFLHNRAALDLGRGKIDLLPAFLIDHVIHFAVNGRD